MRHPASPSGHTVFSYDHNFTWSMKRNKHDASISPYRRCSAWIMRCQKAVNLPLQLLFLPSTSPSISTAPNPSISLVQNEDLFHRPHLLPSPRHRHVQLRRARLAQRQASRRPPKEQNGQAKQPVPLESRQHGLRTFHQALTLQILPTPNLTDHIPPPQCTDHSMCDDWCTVFPPDECILAGTHAFGCTQNNLCSCYVSCRTKYPCFDLDHS